MKKSLENGFTAVELLITLFIAAVFLFAGYQLYTQVTRDGADADKIAKLSNIVYEQMRTKAAQTTALSTNLAGCGASSPSGPTSSVQSIAGVGSTTFITTVSCPQGTAALVDLFYIKVEATFASGGGTRTVTHATYAN